MFQLTAADLAIFNGFETPLLSQPKLLDKYPKMKVHRATIAAIPSLKTYIRSRTHSDLQISLQYLKYNDSRASVLSDVQILSAHNVTMQTHLIAHHSRITATKVEQISVINLNVSYKQLLEPIQHYYHWYDVHYIYIYIYICVCVCVCICSMEIRVSVVYHTSKSNRRSRG